MRELSPSTNELFRTLTRVVCALAPLIWLASGTIASAKPEGPVRIEYTRVERVRAGEQATLVLTFRALTALDRIDVSVAPFKGLEVLSERTATFTNVGRGEGRDMTVTIRLTEEPFGYLSVTYDTRSGAASDGGGTMVIFGSQDQR